MKERVTLTTKDNYTLAADFYPVEASETGIILLHMMPADKTSWTAFAEKLQTRGFHALAVDLRGHGESQDGPQGYERFSDAEHQDSYRDVEAAADFLHSRGIKKVNLAGASIGANLALWYLADNPEIRSAICLSPGLNYRGIETEPLTKRVGKEQGVYFVGSSEDERSSGISAALAAERLYELCTGGKALKIFDGAGHGTVMLERNQDFMDILVGWLEKRNRPTA
ncbi:MAG: alpha/beta fold hydrolase [Candidatus Sungbacteria bacterium]|nr:alpha/beta fold hydrolase [Candidatus Sungbacteria bacterium]